MSSPQSSDNTISDIPAAETDLAMNGYLPNGWVPFSLGSTFDAWDDSSSSADDSSSSEDDSSSSDDDSSSSDDDSSSSDWDDSSSDPEDDKPDTENDQFCNTCSCTCACGKDNVASEAFFTPAHLGDTLDVAMNIVFGVEPDIAGWCPGTFQIRDSNDNSSSVSDPDYNLTSLDSLGFTYNHVSEWRAFLDFYSNLITITKPSGKSLFYRYGEGNSTARRAGETRRFSSLVQTLDSNLSPRTTGKPAYADFTTADGATIRFDLSSCKPVRLVTADQVVVDLTAYENKLKVKRNEVNHIRSVWHHLDGLINIRETYTHPVLGPVTKPLALIEWYPKNQVSSFVGPDNWYETTGAPGKTWYIQQEHITKDQKLYRQLAMMSSRPGHPVSCVDRYLGNNETIIDMPTGKGDQCIRYASVRTLTSEGWEYKTTRRMTDEGATPTSCTRQLYKLIDGIWQEASRTEGYGSACAQITDYTYSGPRLSRVDFHDGGYRSYQYDDNGRIIMETSPWSGGISPDTLGQGEQITATSYADLRFNDYRPSSVSTAIRMPGTTDTEISRETYFYSDQNQERSITVKKTALGSDLEQTSSSVYYGPNALQSFAAGRMKKSQGINGIQTVSSYAATTAHGAAYCITTEQQVDNQPVAGQSTRTVSYIAEDGSTTCAETYAHTGSEWSLLTRETYEYDIYRNRTKTVKANGRTSSTEWMCCGPLRQTDEDGIVTTYSYNAAHQLIETIRAATTTTPETIVSYTRDAAGRATATRTDIGPMTTTTSTVYDALGHTVFTTDELGRTTRYEYSADGLTETVTSPTGAITTTKRHADGQTLSITGNAQQEKKYELYLLSTGLETWSCINHENSWLIVFRTKSDGFGQTIQEQRTSINQNGDFITTLSQYNAKGQLVRQQTGGLSPVRYEYDAMGNMVKQTIDLSPNPSRITENAQTYVSEADGVYRQQTSTAYNAEGQPLTQTSLTLASDLDPELASKTVTIDIRGNRSAQWSHYGAPTQHISYATQPGVDAVASQTGMDGFIIQSTDYAGIVTNYRRSYTAAGMVMTQTDGRGNTSTVEYDSASRPVRTVDGAGNITTTEYDPATGQPSCITDAQGQTTEYRYDERGRRAFQYGTAVQPLAWAYDSANNLTTLWTWRDSDKTINGMPEFAGDITLWRYDPATGLLLDKQYFDGTKDTYSYDSFNRLASKKDARDVTVYYAYRPYSGELEKTTYSDSTHAVTYSYNHLGQPTQVIDASGTRTFHYNQYGELDSEQTAGLVESILTHTRDAWGRTNGYRLKHRNMPLDTVDYAYDTAGRLAASSGFAYAYDTQSGLLNHILYPSGLRREHTWHPDLNIITDIRYNGLNVQTALHPDRYRYDYDSLLRPVSQSDYRNASTKPTVTRTYAYNGRSELTGETATDGTRHAYAYDNIGNRITAQNNATATSYETNLVNQYSSIATQGQGAFTPSYDAAGNQTLIHTATGEWNVQYNADNRPAGFTQGHFESEHFVSCIYDYMGRRIEKTTSGYSGLTKRLRYIYHGYVQIAEIDATDETAPFVTKTYRWDPSEPVATRPLALSVWTREGTVRETLYYAHDLRKNVVSLFDGKGLRRASYQYDPYGNITSMEGDMARENPYRFSSEYHDEDLGLVYYNYRHYNPTDGRWTSRDPIAEKGGVNLYDFVDNNSMSSVDVLGNEITIVRTRFVEPNPNARRVRSLQARAAYFSSGNSIEDDSQDYDFFANKVRDELQKLLGKDCGTLRLQKREEQFPIVQNRRVMSYVKADVYDLHLDPPANPEKCKNASRCIYNILKIMIDADIRYRIARITNLYDNAFAIMQSHTVYINPRIDENTFYLTTISTKVSDPHLMLPQVRSMMLPWSVMLWHELMHAYLNIGHPCIQTNFQSEWEILTGDLIKQQKYDQAMKLYGPFGTKIDPVIYHENIARKALQENGYYPNMKGRYRHPSYFSTRPTRAQRAQFPTHQQPNNRLPCQ